MKTTNSDDTSRDLSHASEPETAPEASDPAVATAQVELPPRGGTRAHRRAARRAKQAAKTTARQEQADAEAAAWKARQDRKAAARQEKADTKAAARQKKADERRNREQLKSAAPHRQTGPDPTHEDPETAPATNDEPQPGDQQDTDIAEDTPSDGTPRTTHPAEPKVPSATVHPLVSRGSKRYLLPVICAALAAFAFYLSFGGALASIQEDPLGPMTVDQVAFMSALAMSILCAFTLLLAILPDPGPVVANLDFNDEVKAAFPGESTPDEIAHVLRRGETTPTSTVLEALAECVTRINIEKQQEAARADHEASAAAALRAEKAELEERLRGILGNTNADGQRIRRESLEEAHRGFQRRVIDIENASQRLIGSLKAGKATAEQEAAEARERVAYVEGNLEQLRLEASAAENRKIRIALEALTRSLTDDLVDPAAQATVTTVVGRLVAAVERMSPIATPAPGSSPLPVPARPSIHGTPVPAVPLATPIDKARKRRARRHD